MYFGERTGVDRVEVMFDVCSIPPRTARATTWGTPRLTELRSNWMLSCMDHGHF